MRNDIHRPSAIVPENYAYVCFGYQKIESFGDCAAILANREILKNHMARTGGDWISNPSAGGCYICGAHCIYDVIFYHAPSNGYIRTGQDCAAKLDMSYGDMNAFRRAIADAREAHAGKRKAIATLADLGFMQAWEIFESSYPQHAESCKAAGRDAFGDDNGCTNPCTCQWEECAKAWNQFPERTIRDIVGKLVKYGSVSEKQTAFIGKLLLQVHERPIVEVARQAERDAAGPVPEGRVTVEGTVLMLKTVEGKAHYYGDSGISTKLLIQLENGCKVWGNRFANLEKDAKVKFIATFEASKKDEKFGFYKRPVVYLSKEQKKAIKILNHVAGHVCNEESCWPVPYIPELILKIQDGVAA